MAVPDLSAQLGQILLPPGHSPTSWGDKTDINYQILEQGTCGYIVISLPSSGTYVLTSEKGKQAQSTNESRQRMLELTGALAAPVTIIVPPIDKFYYVMDNTTGGYTVSFATSGGALVEVPSGYDAIIGCDSIDCFRVQQDIEKAVIENSELISIQQQQLQDLQSFLGGLGTEPEAHPVGSYFLTDSFQNPNALLGYGSWSKEARGATIFGHDDNDPDFDDVSDTGGSKTVTLVEGNLPPHTHSLTINDGGSHRHAMSYPSSYSSRNTIGGAVNGTSSIISSRTTTPGGAHTHSLTVADTGVSAPFSKLPAYRVTNVWRRTA